MDEEFDLDLFLQDVDLEPYEDKMSSRQQGGSGSAGNQQSRQAHLHNGTNRPRNMGGEAQQYRQSQQYYSNHQQGRQNTWHTQQQRYQTYYRPNDTQQQYQQPNERTQRHKTQAQSAAEGVAYRHRRRRWPKVLLVLLILVGLAAVGLRMLLQQPKAPGSGARKKNFSTILLAGTDRDGLRTDTIILAAVDGGEGEVRLLSIPRDTLVDVEYAVPKINADYGWAGGDEDGMEYLIEKVEDVTGITPDGYVLVDLDGFIDLVDLMGGVTFDVPMDMYYNDPSQDLYIDLQEGEQTLDGEEAMGLVRFRSGYTMADLERVNVQRDFLQAAMDQWLSLSSLTKIPSLMKLLDEEVVTDLSRSNVLWLAKTMLGCDLGEISTETIPGWPVDYSSGSYYVVDRDAVLDVVNDGFNPMEEDVEAEDLNIREG